MKRVFILAVALAALLLLLLFSWPHRSRITSAPVGPPPPTQALAPADSRAPAEAARPAGERAAVMGESSTVTTNQDYGAEAATRYHREFPDLPVAFYGLVRDQDSNALQGVRIDINVTQWDADALPGTALKMAHVEGQTGADGRFQVNGLSGHTVTISRLTKDGYEPELIRRNYGEYGPQAGSINEPVIFCMWSTNLHEPLITGEKSFVMIPDGRRYAVDLIKGTIAEGEEGDLVAWIKRPQSVRWGQRYDWSCELTTPGGGLIQDSHYPMFTAPESGYTNAFAYREEAGINGWGGSTGDKHFYVKLRKGSMYGRVAVDLYADYYGKQPAMIRLSYAINPSGSRLLR